MIPTKCFLGMFLDKCLYQVLFSHMIPTRMCKCFGRAFFKQVIQVEPTVFAACFWTSVFTQLFYSLTKGFQVSCFCYIFHCFGQAVSVASRKLFGIGRSTKQRLSQNYKWELSLITMSGVSNYHIHLIPTQCFIRLFPTKGFRPHVYPVFQRVPQ